MKTLYFACFNFSGPTPVGSSLFAKAVSSMRKFNKEDQDYVRENLSPKGLEHWKFKEYYKGLNLKSTNGFGSEKSLSGKRSYSTVVNISPVKVYKNADLDKLRIITDNKGKAGVYRWINIANGKSYIGSSVDLGGRLKDYFTLRYLELGLKKSQSHIYRSLLKRGYNNFSLEILEYCESEKALEREQHYLDLLHPEYNILKKAGSLYGFKHSEETKANFKIRSPKQLEHWKNLHANPEEQARRSEHIKRINLSNKGRPRPEGAGTPSVSIEVLDTLTDQITVYTSISEAARAIGVGKSSIGMAFKYQEEKGVSTIWIKKKRYQITKLRSI
jgi:group I intron endonuclease